MKLKPSQPPRVTQPPSINDGLADDLGALQFLPVVETALKVVLTIDALLGVISGSRATYVVSHRRLPTRFMTTAYCEETNVLLRSFHAKSVEKRLSALPSVAQMLRQTERMASPVRYVEEDAQ